MSNPTDYQPDLCFQAKLPGGSIELSLMGLPAPEFNSVSATLELTKYEDIIQASEGWLD